MLIIFTKLDIQIWNQYKLDVKILHNFKEIFFFEQISIQILEGIL